MILPTPQDIRNARLELGLSQEEAAQIVGVPESMWQKWETPVELDSYELIRGSSWASFLVQTTAQRSSESRWYINPRRLNRSVGSN